MLNPSAVARRIALVFASALAATFLASSLSPALGIAELHAQDTTKDTSKIATWKIDQAHSELTFSVRHLISKVRGHFNTWEGTILADPDDWSTAAVEVTIQTASINTGNANRDAHLRTDDFFLAEKYPTLTFKSTKVERKGDTITLAGDLTMRGVTKPIVLKGMFTGMTKNKDGKLRAGFEASTTINRQDWGLKWNRAVEAGGMTLGDDVKIELHIAAVQQ